jgi:nicotinamide mononucleotide transporter
MSWLELVATIFSIACVWLAVKKNILNWPVAIIAIFLSFLLFYQSALYADSFLQIYFFVTSIYGWWYWTRKTDEINELPVTELSNTERLSWILGILFSTVLASYIMLHLNPWFPDYFPKPTAYPIPDSFILVASIAGQWLLAKKKLDNWYCWIMVNCTAVIVYFLKDIKLFSILYFLLLIMAMMGIYSWRKQHTVE